MRASRRRPRRRSPSLRIGRVTIAPDRPCAVIAEAACEHLGSLAVAKRMVVAAKEAGADLIKFQLHLPEEMIPGSVQFWAGSMDEVLARYNLSVDAHQELIRYCEEVGIQYLCTPFCIAAADILDELGVPAFKTGSGELTNLPMLRHIARKGKPMIVSTGMATMEEIAETVEVLKQERAAFVLMHCTSEYPPPYDHLNLRCIPLLRDTFGVLVGHSDHTPDGYSALAAVALGAKVIEKHFTLARRLGGPDHHVSLEPQELKAFVDGVRKIEAALGAQKRLYPQEKIVRAWAHHSVVTRQAITQGERFTESNLTPKRPGHGIPSKYLDRARYDGRVLGRCAKRPLPANVLLKWTDIA